MTDSLLFNFRMPVKAKQSFERHCITRNVSMTSQLNILIEEFMRTESLTPMIGSSDDEMPLSFYVQV